MGKQIKVVIPSHLRHDRVTTTKAVDQCILCVEESQKDIYKEFNPDTEIVAHPNSIKGLNPKREWMYKHFGELFMIDDDAKYLNRLYVEKGERSRVDKKTAYDLIQNLYAMALEIDCKLFSFNKNPMPTAYNPLKPIELTGVVMGGSFGILPTEKLYFDEKFVLSEDYFISGINAYHYRKCLIDQRFAFTFKDTFGNTGGCASYRTMEKEKQDTLLLKRYFGDAIQLKKDTHLAKTNMPYSRSLKIPY